MTSFPFLESEIDRVIRLLNGSSVRLSLMSVTCSGFGFDAFRIAAQAASRSIDLTGLLPDSSVGILSLCGPNAAGAASTEDRFLPKLRALLTTACDYRDSGDITVFFRSIRRPACELDDSQELLQSLSNTQVRRVTIAMRSPAPRTSRPDAWSEKMRLHAAAVPCAAF